ncbi:hypothetical protein [Rhodococcus sp. 105337]|nr:hypothetical protein [Rhodococcus sp. 105337]NME80352.1 hypothetical protein [Rhodococcus sp. 105337]
MGLHNVRDFTERVGQLGLTGDSFERVERGTELITDAHRLCYHFGIPAQ